MELSETAFWGGQSCNRNVKTRRLGRYLHPRFMFELEDLSALDLNDVRLSSGDAMYIV